MLCWFCVLDTVLRGPWEWIYEVWTTCMSKVKPKTRSCVFHWGLSADCRVFTATKDTAGISKGWYAATRELSKVCSFLARRLFGIKITATLQSKCLSWTMQQKVPLTPLDFCIFRPKTVKTEISSCGNDIN